MKRQVVDLHCHSTISDGILTPEEVALRAVTKGVTLWALTDHDAIAGIIPAYQIAEAHNVLCVSGVEISAAWHNYPIHIVGLGFDVQHPVIVTALQKIRAGRLIRAAGMASEFDKIGIHGTLEGAKKYAKNPELIGRAHFARYLVEMGYASNVNAVFKKYLAAGKPGYFPHQWAEFTEAISWIQASGGVAVLAHPGRYEMIKGEREQRLLAEFKEAGGVGLEVISGSHTPDQHRFYEKMAKQYGFEASVGSDFHEPPKAGETDLGQLSSLPEGLTPVWERWLN